MALRMVLVGLALAAGSCGSPDDEAPPAAPNVERDPCGNRCSNVELCVKDAAGGYGCALICANQLRCWSNCCVRVDDSDYKVCRPRDVCYPDE
jgi:hypothetical protein